MDKASRAKLPFRKIIGICLILLLVSGIGVFASNAKLNHVKIILANGYEMDVLTTKTKVSDILTENHIVLLPEENVVPNAEREISDNHMIRITRFEETIEDDELSKVDDTIAIEDIMSFYDAVIEKIETIQETIPYETITKDASEGSSTKRDTVIQEGRDGIREVTYKIKYQNGEEIERKEIASNIIQEPINKVVEVRKINITSRGEVDRSSTTTYNNGVWSYSAEDLDLLCAITAAECSVNYEGALAVITCACNRAASSRWAKNGADPLSQYKAKGQFCYSINSAWRRRLNGNYSGFVKQAVLDALNGKRNHNYLSFRASYTGRTGEIIGDNVYFNAM